MPVPVQGSEKKGDQDWLKHTGPAQSVEINSRGESVGTASSAGLLRGPIVTRVSCLGLIEISQLRGALVARLSIGMGLEVVALKIKRLFLGTH